MTDLPERFSFNMQQNGLRPEETPILLCVSGGIDSVVMAELFHKSGFSLGIAHVNYRLRNQDSDEDEEFVKQLASKLGATFFVLQASEQICQLAIGESLQMAARRIRYHWFDELLSEGQFTFAATAHHADDEAETFLMNINRGAGGRGSKGYDFQRGQYLKPMNGFSRNEIELYAREYGISWREDSSNSKDIYLRNNIRHHVIPAIKEVFPDFTKRLHETFIRLKRERNLYEYLVHEQSKSLLIPLPQGIEIKAKELMLLPDPAMILFEFIREYGFSMPDCESICKNLTKLAGQLYLSGKWRARLERGKIFIFSALDSNNPIEPRLSIIDIVEMPDLSGPIPKSAAYIDQDKLQGNLYLRKWQTGDQFWPTGMKGKKLISNFLNELKIPYTQKAQQYLLMCGEDVVWVVNHRIDRRYTADKQSKRILLVQVD